MTDRASPWIRRLLRTPVRLYRWRLGWLLGHRFLLLEHRGRRSGRRHETVLEVVSRHPGGEVLVLSGWGRSSDWFLNVVSHGRVRVTVGRRRYAVACRELPEDEAAAVLADYEYRNRFVRPVLNRVLSSLVGWRYDGSEASRRRLVRQLPMVAFSPAPEPAHEGVSGA